MHKANETSGFYDFGAFRLIPAERQLLRDGKPIHLTPKAFDTLLFLVENSGRLLAKDELLKRIWPDTFVEEATLARNVFTLRKALGEGQDEFAYIETIPKVGYRFVAEVRASGLGEVGVSAGASNVASQEASTRRFRLAMIGAAGLALVLAAIFTFRDRTVANPRVHVGKVMLVVMPFQNLSGDPAEDYLSDGLTEELITQLGRMAPEQLGVIARTSAMQYKDTRKRVDQIGRELGVDYLLEGSIRRSGDHVRVSAQLIQVRDQTHLWAEEYDSHMRDLLDMERSVARSVAREMAVELTPEQRVRMTTPRPVDPEAYDAYLEGRFFWNKRTQAGLEKAIERFNVAIAIDPDYALAYAGLADCYNLLDEYSIRPSKESFPKAKAAALNALKIDAELAEAHSSLAYERLHFDWDWPGAEQEFRRAIELNPNYATAHQWYGEYLVAMGRFDEANAEIGVARKLDPLSLATNLAQAFSLYYSRRYGEAVGQYEKVAEMDPNLAAAHYGLGWAEEQTGNATRALAEFQKAVDLLGKDTDAIAAIGYVDAHRGEKQSALRVIDQLESLSQRKYVSPVNIAIIYAALGRNDQAIEWLQKARKARYGWLPYVKVDPRLEPLHSDPRFQELLHGIGLPS